MHSTILCTVYSHMGATLFQQQKTKHVMKTLEDLINQQLTFLQKMLRFFESSTPIKILRRLKSCQPSVKGRKQFNCVNGSKVK